MYLFVGYLSAAFDTIDTGMLLTVLELQYGITGAALSWIRDFLTNRSQRVRIDDTFSDAEAVQFGVPQGSILGPLLYNMYTSSQNDVFNECSFRSSGYADDANGRKRFSLVFQYSVLKYSIEQCINNIIKWMNNRKLKINPEKTEICLFHPKILENEVIINGTFINGQCVRFSRVIKNVGVLLDNKLLLTNQVNKVVSHSYK